MMKLYLVVSTIEQEGYIYYKWCLYNEDRELIFQSKNAETYANIQQYIKIFTDIFSYVRKLSNDVLLYLKTNLQFMHKYFWRNCIIEELHYDDFAAFETLKNAMKDITPIKVIDGTEVKFLNTKEEMLLDQLTQFVDACKKVDNGN